MKWKKLLKITLKLYRHDILKSLRLSLIQDLIKLAWDVLWFSVAVSVKTPLTSCLTSRTVARSGEKARTVMSLIIWEIID